MGIDRDITCMLHQYLVNSDTANHVFIFIQHCMDVLVNGALV